VYSEAVRTLLIQILRPSAQVVLVTSALPREGKTVTALSLAASAARSGRRTVLVDLDLRHPSVAREGELDMQAGLEEFMSGAVELAKVIHTSPIDGRLHILPLHTKLSGSADQLLNWDVSNLINTLRQSYDCIMLDGPPSLAINDIQRFASVVDATLLVVKWGSTSCSAAVNGVTVLSQVGLLITGVALTQVDLKRYALYGYEQFGEYHKHYLEYFHG